MEQVDDFAGRVKAKRVEVAPGTTMFSLAGRLNDFRLPDGRWSPIWRRDAQAVRSGAGDSSEWRFCRPSFDDVLRDPRRYGIENTTDKVRRPGAVRRRRDAVCTERIVVLNRPMFYWGRLFDEGFKIRWIGPHSSIRSNLSCQREP